MLDVDPPPTAKHLEMIEALTDCAFDLGQAAFAIAKAPQQDAKGFLAASAEFRHCFFSVRMGVRLSAQLRAGPSFAVPRAGQTQEAGRCDAVERPEPLEHERAETLQHERAETLEREREGDYEPVSLPKFLTSLGLAAAAAERRGDELPAHIRDTTLPTLRGLLAKAGAPAEPTTTTGLAVLARPPAPRPPVDRSRLLSSAFTPTLRRRDSS